MITKEIDFLKFIAEEITTANYGEGYEVNLSDVKSKIRKRISALSVKEENELKDAFEAGKYLGFGEAHRRPGDYSSFEEWQEIK